MYGHSIYHFDFTYDHWTFRLHIQISIAQMNVQFVDSGNEHIDVHWTFQMCIQIENISKVKMSVGHAIFTFIQRIYRYTVNKY